MRPRPPPMPPRPPPAPRPLPPPPGGPEPSPLGMSVLLTNKTGAGKPVNSQELPSRLSAPAPATTVSAARAARRGTKRRTTGGTGRPTPPKTPRPILRHHRLYRAAFNNNGFSFHKRLGQDPAALFKYAAYRWPGHAELPRHFVLVQPFEVRQAYRLETIQRQHDPLQAARGNTGRLEKARNGSARNVSEVWFSTQDC